MMCTHCISNKLHLRTLSESSLYSLIGLLMGGVVCYQCNYIHDVFVELKFISYDNTRDCLTSHLLLCFFSFSFVKLAWCCQSNSWGLHMPLVCRAIVAYAWKHQLAKRKGKRYDKRKGNCRRETLNAMFQL
jgi:hypothetical protein